MNSFTEKLDSVGGIETDGWVARYLERGAFIFVVLMALTSPHSIAASQTSWLAGMLLLAIRMFIRPRPQIRLGLQHYLLLAFFTWAAISSFFSYEPATSIDLLRNVGLFLVFFFVVFTVRNLKAVYLIAFALIVSCMVNVVWTPIQRMIGRGVEVHGISPESPLAKALIYNGDTILKANGRVIKRPEDLVAELEQNVSSRVTFYRPDFEFSVDVKREFLQSGPDANARLGIETWRKSHNWRSQGFFGHYTTYSEVLMLIGSLTFGLLVASWRGIAFGRARTASGPMMPTVLLAIAVAGISLALLLTVTRASQLAFLASSALILLLGASRKVILLSAAIIIPVVIGGLFFLQQSRNTGFFDASDTSTQYRFTMWRDGTRLVTDSPRNLVFGLGMDSLKTHWREWGMFEGGKLAMGHFHSTPIQILVERGVPAILLWLGIVAVYARRLWRGLWDASDSDWRNRGVMLGCAGALLGFVLSGLVHYNLGDSEVAMVFYLLMGIGTVTAMLVSDANRDDPDVLPLKAEA